MEKTMSTSPFDALRQHLRDTVADFRRPTDVEMSPGARCIFLLDTEALHSWSITSAREETIMGFPVKIDRRLPDGVVRLMDGPVELACFSVALSPTEAPEKDVG
jgi:hypothetical protein